MDPDDEKVVRRCWIMLSEALEELELEGESVRSALSDVNCVPNSRNVLWPPSWIVFEDRPDLRGKFELLMHNSIARQDRVWLAMAAAGVKPISDVVQGFVHEAVNRQQDEDLKRRVMERAGLIRTILSHAVQPGDIPLHSNGPAQGDMAS